MEFGWRDVLDSFSAKHAGLVAISKDLHAHRIRTKNANLLTVSTTGAGC